MDATQHEAHTSTVWAIAINPNNSKQFVSCSDDRSIILWQYNEAKKQYEFITRIEDVHTRTIYSVDWSTNGYIASAGADDEIAIYKVFDTDDSIQLQTVCQQQHAHDSDVNCVAWNPKNPSLLASVSDDSFVSLWQFTP